MTRGRDERVSGIRSSMLFMQEDHQIHVIDIDWPHIHVRSAVTHA